MIRDRFVTWHKQQTGRAYVFDSVSSPVFEAVADFFAGASRSQGLLLCGPVGVGKTTLMRFFGCSERFRVISCSSICRSYQQCGNEVFDRYAHPSLYPGAPRETATGVCFDDLGAEPTAKTVHYGTSLSVMAEALMEVYSRRSSWSLFHATTNLNYDQIKEKYGIRVADRMKELFTVIRFPYNARSRREISK